MRRLVLSLLQTSISSSVNLPSKGLIPSMGCGHMRESRRPLCPHKRDMLIAGPNQNPIQKLTLNDDIFVSIPTLNGYSTFKTLYWGSLYQSVYIDTTYVYGVGGVDLQFHIPIRNGRFKVQSFITSSVSLRPDQPYTFLKCAKNVFFVNIVFYVCC